MFCKAKHGPLWLNQRRWNLTSAGDTTPTFPVCSPGAHGQVMLRFKIGVLHKASQWKKGLLPPSINCLQLMVRRRGLCLECHDHQEQRRGMTQSRRRAIRIRPEFQAFSSSSTIHTSHVCATSPGCDRVGPSILRPYNKSPGGQFPMASFLPVAFVSGLLSCGRVVSPS